MIKKELMQFEFDLNTQLRDTERNETRNLKQMEEDGKDRRENIKAGAKGAKRFESSGNDVLEGGMRLSDFNPQIGT